MAAPFDTGLTLADRMRRHAGDSTHLYAHLMRAMADDWEAGGPVRDVCAGWEDAPAGTVVQLRLLGGLFRIVLTGRAPELEPFYACLGGTAAPAAAWPVVRPVIATHVAELQDALLVAPQTNEVGRANALVVGLFAAVRRTGRSKIRLLEPGASAGLNLLVDQFRFVNQGWALGPIESPVVLASGIHGDVQPAEFEIVERRGCDLAPVDATTVEGRLRLRSFVWPFHVERHGRLAGALRLAEQSPPVVDRASASTWLAQQTASAGDDDVVTVVWQSITRLYWPGDEIERVDEVIAAAASRGTVAHVSMEYARLGDDSVPELTCEWSDGGGDLHREVLGTVGDHGFPVIVAG